VSIAGGARRRLASRISHPDRPSEIASPTPGMRPGPNLRRTENRSPASRTRNRAPSQAAQAGARRGRVPRRRNRRGPKPPTGQRISGSAAAL
jgi:hypothetical protein